ncbi:MAG: PAS domain S-box protein, partial [Chloracidobacterium sp.]
MTDHPRYDALPPELLAALFQDFELPLLLIDYDTRRVIAVNNAFVLVSGYTADQVVGQETKQFSIFPSDDEREQVYTQLSAQGRTAITLLVRRPRGDVGEISLRLTLLEVGGRRYITAQVDGVTGVDPESRSQIEQLRDVLAVVPGVIYQYTFDVSGKGRFTYIGGRSDELFGLSAEVIATDERTFWRQVPYEHRLRIRDTFAPVFESQRPWGEECPFRHAITGEERWLQIVAFPRAAPDGGTIWTGFCSDITEIHRLRTSQMEAQDLLEKERLRKSKLESLGTLAGGIAHDFNNLLAVLTGNIGLIKHELSLSPANQRRFDAIEQATERAKLLAKQLVTFAKGGDPILESVSPEVFVIE